ncbi:TPA: hypothetical protein N3B91_003764 [Vibrio parahaemolyticus]|nr:hypothetical protein [Vibrio parahaemolyticus]
MSSKVKVNQDIFDALNRCHSNEFSIIDIRNMIQKASEQYENNSVARLFVARSLERLESKGLLESTGKGRKKKFSKTATFASVRFDAVPKRERSNTKEPCLASCELTEARFQLEAERKDIETELTVTLAEIEEYQSLMSRYRSLQKLIYPTYQEATKKSAKLMAQLNVWTNTVTLINQNQEGKSAC